MEEKITISIHISELLNDNRLYVIRFIENNNVFFLVKTFGSAKDHEKEKEEVINLFRSYQHSESLKQSFSIKFARDIWDLFIKRGYEQLTQLENIVNSTNESFSEIDLEIYGLKIRDKTTGLYSKGGTSPENIWSKNGKSWTKLSHLKSHVTMINNLYLSPFYKKIKGHTKKVYDNAEIVILRENKSISINDMKKVEDELDKKNC